MRTPRRRVAALALPLLLAAGGCATGPTLDQRLATFVGRPEADVVAALGVPVRTYEAGGRKFLQFESRRSVAVAEPPGYYGGPWGWRRGYYWAPPPQTYAVVGCDVTFALRDGLVEGFTFRGDGCA